MKRPSKNANEAKRQSLERRRVRKLLRDLLLDWQHVSFNEDEERRIHVHRGEDHRATFSLRELRATMAPEHFDVFCTLWGLLQEQAIVAEYAMPLAKFDIASVKKKASGSTQGGLQTKAKAAKRHKPIAAALAEGQTVKAVSIERQLAGKKASSASTIYRVKKGVKKAKGL